MVVLIDSVGGIITVGPPSLRAIETLRAMILLYYYYERANTVQRLDRKKKNNLQKDSTVEKINYTAIKCFLRYPNKKKGEFTYFS